MYRSHLCGLALAVSIAWACQARADDWPMLAHDAGRSGATATEVRPPFARKWYRAFPDEGIQTGVQPVIAGGRVFLGTLAGKLHALDAATGRDVWVYQAGGPLLHAAAVADGRVFCGAADGKVYAVNADTGAALWSTATGSAVWNAPAVVGDLVLIGSRDGKLYALDADSGAVRWAQPTGGPILGSPAVDAKLGHIYVGSEDMHVYAWELATGRPVWTSAKLPGASLRGYHPVIAPDGSVMVTVTPALSADTIQTVMMDMVKDVFGDMASWRHQKEENQRLQEQNLRQLADPQTYPRQMEYLRRRLTEQPAYQTFFVLDPATGRQKFVTPLVYAESMNGPGSPALVTPAGKVIVKYSALLRSRYGAYSPFLNVGYLDTATGTITPLMDQSRTYGWHDSLLLIHDEMCQLAVGGKVLFNTHQDNVNALDLDTLKGYGQPMCWGVHEANPGVALAVWARHLRGEPLPVGYEWFARGTAVYGGGSIIDVPIAIAGDSFYFLPTHEINAGVVLVACRMQADGKAAQRDPEPKEQLTAEEWAKVRTLKWDWDLLEMGRLNQTLKSSAAVPVPGTRRAPLTDAATAAVAQVPDAALLEIIRQTPSFAAPAADDALARHSREQLAAAVEELIAGDWQPLVFPAGKFPGEAYRFFTEPTETLYTLALAYPHLSAALQEKVRGRVAQLSAGDGPLAGPTGQRTYASTTGQVRSAFDVPPTALLKFGPDLLRSDTARLYPLWLWAHVTGDWGRLRQDWPKLRPLVRAEPAKDELDCGNARLAGLIAGCRIARQLQDDATAAALETATLAALRQRLIYELAHTEGGLIGAVPTLRTIFARWHFLTPEVGRLLAAHAQPIHQHLMDVYVDHHRPTWCLAWNVELMWRNETNLMFPTAPAEVFAARALVLGEAPAALERGLDLPWCKADEYYIQKLALLLQRCQPPVWK